MAEDDYEDGEKADSPVVVTLEGERWEHVDDTGRAKTVYRESKELLGRDGCTAFSYILGLFGGQAGRGPRGFSFPRSRYGRHWSSVKIFGSLLP